MQVRWRQRCKSVGMRGDRTWESAPTARKHTADARLILASNLSLFLSSISLPSLYKCVRAPAARLPPPQPPRFSHLPISSLRSLPWTLSRRCALPGSLSLSFPSLSPLFSPSLLSFSPLQVTQCGIQHSLLLCAYGAHTCYDAARSARCREHASAASAGA